MTTPAELAVFKERCDLHHKVCEVEDALIEAVKELSRFDARHARMSGFVTVDSNRVYREEWNAERNLMLAEKKEAGE